MISDAEIYEYLLGPFEIGGMYISPAELRRGDTNASFGVYEDGGILKWHDFGLPRKAVGKKAIDLLMEMRGVSYHEAKQIIEKEIVPSRIGRGPLKLRKVEHLTGLPYIQHRDHRDFELTYWKKFHQTKFDLVYESIYALNSLQYADSHYRVTSNPKDPAFVYLFQANPYQCKIYRPHNPANKFRMFNCAGHIEGWSSMIREYSNLDRPLDRLFITSSTKDRLCLKKTLSLSESAINPLSEKIWREITFAKDKIHSLAKEIIVIFDGDATGEQMSRDLAEEIGGKARIVTGNLGWDEENDKPVKDLARCTELFGIEKLQEFYDKI